LATRWPMDTATNQKHTYTTKGIQGKRFNRGGSTGGGFDPIVLAAIEVEKMVFELTLQVRAYP
jgi:hypothetical protein